MPDLATVTTLATALGVGGIIGQWYGAGKDRRTARAAVLQELAAVERARWWTVEHGADWSKLELTIRNLQSAALIARVPRSAVMPYSQLATAAFQASCDEAEERGDPDYAGIPTEIADAVREAAEVVSRAAWSPPATRWLWLHMRLWANQRRVNAITDEDTKRRISRARETVR